MQVHRGSRKEKITLLLKGRVGHYSINKLLKAVPEKFVSAQKKGNIKHFMMKKEVLDDILLENTSV